MRFVSVVVLAALAGAVVVGAADWAQFQGPRRDGVSPETALARAWPKEGPKEVWRIPMQAGFGGPAVEGNQVYIMDHDAGRRDVLRCLDLAGGKELWQFAYDAPGKLNFEGSRSTPAVDEKHVYIVGPFGAIHCIDKTTHQPVWAKDLVKDFGTAAPMWHISQSPLLYKDTVIVAPQSERAALAALNKDTGAVVWTSKPIGLPSYASPLLAKIDGVDQAVMLCAAVTGAESKPMGGDYPTTIAGIDAAGGEVLWTYGEFRCKIPIPGPTAIGDGRFFVTGGYKGGCNMFKVAREAGKFSAVKLFANMNCGSQIQNAILYKDHLYANSGDTKGGLVCMDLDGNVKWQTGPQTGFDMGNLIIADGMIYIMDGAKGVLHLVDASPDGYKELAAAPVLAGKTIWAPMALSGGQLILRDQTQVKCLDVSGK